MLDLNDLQRAGHSTSKRAWLTNPARRSLLVVARPYLARLIQAINDIEARERAGALRVKDELIHLRGMLDALRKDQMAINHRLGNVEDQTPVPQESGAALNEKMLQCDRAIEALRDEQRAVNRRLGLLEGAAETRGPLSGSVGLTTLPHNQPIAIAGTSLVLHDGPYGRFLLRQSDLIGPPILSGAFRDSHLRPVFERAGRPDRSALDAGAYIGFHTVYMARYFRTVHAFEPQIEIYRMLCANLVLNNCRNVIAIHAALSDVPSCMRLGDGAEQEVPLPGQVGAVDSGRVGNAAALAFHPTDARDECAAPTRTVDELGLTDLGLLKLEMQGGDLRVLRGASATIQRCRPIIAAESEREFAKGHNNPLDDYYHFFKGVGYAVEVLDGRGQGTQVGLLATPR